MIEVDMSRCGIATKIMLEVCETVISRVCFKVNRSVEVVHGGLVVGVERWATVVTFVWGRCRTGAFVWGRLANPNPNPNPNYNERWYRSVPISVSLVQVPEVTAAAN